MIILTSRDKKLKKISQEYESLVHMLALGPKNSTAVLDYEMLLVQLHPLKGADWPSSQLKVHQQRADKAA